VLAKRVLQTMAGHMLGRKMCCSCSLGVPSVPAAPCAARPMATAGHAPAYSGQLGVRLRGGQRPSGDGTMAGIALLPFYAALAYAAAASLALALAIVFHLLHYWRGALTGRRASSLAPVLQHVEIWELDALSTASTLAAVVAARIVGVVLQAGRVGGGREGGMAVAEREPPMPAPQAAGAVQASAPADELPLLYGPALGECYGVRSRQA
jgi:hypothetical protein